MLHLILLIFVWLLLIIVELFLRYISLIVVSPLVKCIDFQILINKEITLTFVRCFNYYRINSYFINDKGNEFVCSIILE